VITLRRKGESVKNRILVIGSPNTGKTSLLSTIEDEKVAVLSFPDEKGIKSIPEKENIESFIFEIEPLKEECSNSDRYKLSLEKYNIVLSTTRSILKQNFDLFFGDGLSKFYQVCLDVATKGLYSSGNEFEARLYGTAHVLFSNYLNEVYSSPIKTTVFTSWEKLGQEDENSSDQEKRENLKRGNRVWIPALPGQMANISTGEFDAVIRAGFTNTPLCSMCSIFREKKLESKIISGEHHTFQLKPKDDVQCVGIKGKRNKKIPTFIHQEWSYLKELILS